MARVLVNRNSHTLLGVVETEAIILEDDRFNSTVQNTLNSWPKNIPAILLDPPLSLQTSHPAQAPSWPSPRSLALQLQLHCCFWPYCVHLFSLHLIFNPEFFYRILPWTHHSDSDLPDRFWKVTTKLWPLASEDRTTVSWLLLWLR